MDSGEANAVRAEEAVIPPVARLGDWVSEGLIAHERLVERLLCALLADGHVLIEGPPGIAKTRAVKRLAGGLPVSFGRIQCTPDLMPADLIGTQVFRAEAARFDFIEGPVFNGLVLVDEINRAPPKVQSALLEAMAERQVTAGGATRPLPDPFLVVATQNSIEHEGTFPLPEAQLDRFLMCVELDLPGKEAELAILDLVEGELAGQGAPFGDALTHEEIFAARRDAAQVYLSPALKDYIARLVVATREAGAVPDLREAIAHPVSPRGTLALAAAVRARAYLHGRDHGLPEDVAELAHDVLAHRLIPTWRAQAEGQTARSLVDRLLAAVQPY